MMLMVEHNWALAGAVVALALVLAWLAFGRRKPPRRRFQAPDALDAGAAPAARNQALIDAPSATAAAAGAVAGLAASGPDVFAGIGEVIAAGSAREAGSAVLTGDDLTRIKGVGPKLSQLLAELGISRFAAIAAWSDADMAAVDAQLGAFAGRPARDGWVEQCRLLAAGDIAGFEARFGRV